MNEICPFCKSEIVKLGLNRIDLRLCPSCFAAFFPAAHAMAFRRELFQVTREKWLKVLESKHFEAKENSELKCVLHKEPLVKGKLPNYGIDGEYATCCDMLHLTPAQLVEILKRSLEGSAFKKETKHHFFFIHWFDKLISKLLKNESLAIEDDPIESMQYTLHFKKILEPEK